mmetsp:Transcript_20621/g.51620  ORF Transcript_20621/g.51620 Transcript_20621/m.51620 type:complete len:248 (-) Transcript_20621:643-1386(-)
MLRDLDLVVNGGDVKQSPVGVVADATQRDGDTLELLNFAVLGSKPSLPPPLLQQHQGFARVPPLKVDVPLVDACSVLLIHVESLAGAVKDTHLAGPEEVAPAGSVDLDASNNGVLAVAGVDGDLGGFGDFVQDALIGSIRELDQRRHLPIRQVPHELLLHEALFNVCLVQPEAHLAALDLRQDTKERSACARCVAAVRAEALADLAVGSEGNVGRDPKDVSLLTPYDWSVCHCSLEPRPPAKDEPGE